jgi:four helix bundle suffix protein
MDNEGFIPGKGNYQALLSYQKSLIIYDGTVIFCRRFLNKRDRTYDQMIQAARSGKQNIIEGSKASLTSSETEIKLTNVARASLEELLEDYKDFLRSGKLQLWARDSKEAVFTRDLSRKPGASTADFDVFFESRPPETVANILICLIHQCSYLLYRQIKHLEKEFLKTGGIKEKMYASRKNHIQHPRCSPKSQKQKM